MLWEDDLERLNGEWGRYKDVDGDGIPYRTVPGNRHPRAPILPAAPVMMKMPVILKIIRIWHDLLDRLKRKYETARRYVPEPVIETMDGAQIGMIAFGSTEPAIQEARAQLAEHGIPTDFLRVRAIPLTQPDRRIYPPA